MNPRLLIIEDELALRTVLQDFLERHGYRVLVSADGANGLQRALHEKPDLILLDLMLPRLDGFSICRELRRLGFTGRILILTARGRVEDRIQGLDLGADDYLAKPFSREELLARIRALLRRQDPENATLPTVVQLGEVRIDLPARRAWQAEREIEMSPKEFSMLEFFLVNPGRVISREEFLDRVWGVTAFPTTRTVDKHVVTLRQKIESDPAQPRWIQTVHGVGYRYDPPASPG